ncbi:MAG TPA: hypothetical protein VNH18_15140, partial [Bryobacteraceae bacterium]|nr:hypothetical protein [Bryobacteraceae bacterium]
GIGKAPGCAKTAGDEVIVATETVTCRCCSAKASHPHPPTEGRNNPKPCNCSPYFCTSTEKCLTHCPLLRGAEPHECGTPGTREYPNVTYPENFTYDFTPVP